MHISKLTALLVEAETKKQKIQTNFSTLNSESSCSDCCDLADRNQTQQHLSLELNQVNNLIAQLNRASIRFENGDYGFCTVCGDEISPARLAFNVCIETCVDCQNNIEQKAHAVA